MTSPGRPRPDRTHAHNRWWVLALGSGAQGANAAVFLGLPSVVPQLRAYYGLDLPLVGILLGTVSLGAMTTPGPVPVLFRPFRR